MALDGTLVLEEILQAKQHLQLRYDELFPALCDSYPDMFPPEYYTWEQYLWACELWYSNSMRIMFPDGKLRTCLIPVAGFLNHSICPHIMHYGKIDAMTNTLKFPLCRPCKAGEQCCLSYGNLPSSHLLTFYGFLPQGSNPYDVIPLDIGGAQEFLSAEMSLELESNEHMVRATWLSANQEIFYYGLPTPLLDHLRRLRSPSLHTMTLLQENLENEIAILEDIQAIFEGMMEELGDTDDRDNNSWDVKLAIEFKDTQRVIVSSVLVSCGDGRRMVVDELMKCMSEDMLG